MSVGEFGDFLLGHMEVKYVVIHAGVQYMLLLSALEDIGHPGHGWWLEVVNQGYLSDLIVLDGLVELAGVGTVPLGSSLTEVADRAERLTLSVEVGDVLARDVATSQERIRKRRQNDRELVLACEAIVGAMTSNPGFVSDGFSTSTCHALAGLVWDIHTVIDTKAVDIMNGCCADRNHTMFRDAVFKFGPLSEGIQIKGALALGACTSTGICIDRQAVQHLADSLLAEINAQADYIQTQMPKYRMCFQYKRIGGAQTDTTQTNTTQSAAAAASTTTPDVPTGVKVALETVSDDEEEADGVFESGIDKLTTKGLFSLDEEALLLRENDGEDDGWSLVEAPREEIEFLKTKSGKPRFSRKGTQKALVLARRETIEAIIKERAEVLEAAGVTGVPEYRLLTKEEEYTYFSLPRDGSEISIRMKKWGQYARKSEFVARYCTLIELCKLYSIVVPLRDVFTVERSGGKGTVDIAPLDLGLCPDGVDRVVVHPRYVTVMRNGRTATFDPHIQGTPSTFGFRELYLARPGHVLLTVDYSFIELCTLAAVCQARYGSSVLAQVIRDGVDPHAFTAAVCDRTPLDEFMLMKDSADPAVRERFKYLRQRAKAINFGLPGGQGARSLREYAASFGVTLSYGEAKELRQMFTQDVYPEIGMYLNEHSLSLLAANLRRDVTVVRKKLMYHFVFDGQDETIARSNFLDIKMIVRGRPYRRDGLPYAAHFVQNIWQSLRDLNQNPNLVPLLEGRSRGGDEVYEALFHQSVVTLTGRVRGGVNFTQARNTPFSGLAADGAKLALWDLYHSGYSVIGFVHDEIIVELPVDSDLDNHVQQVSRICEAAMAPLCPGIPIATAFTLSHRWHKSQDPKTCPTTGRLIPSDDPGPAVFDVKSSFLPTYRRAQEEGSERLPIPPHFAHDWAIRLEEEAQMAGPAE